MERREPTAWAFLAASPNKAVTTRRFVNCAGVMGVFARLALLFSLSASALAETESATAVPGPTLLRKCCGAHEVLNAQLDDCVAWSGAGGAGAEAGAGLSWERAEAVRARAGDGFPWWANAATPVYDARTGEPSARPFLGAQPPDASLRYGPRPPCASGRVKYFTWNSASRFRLLSNGTLLLRTDDVPSGAAPALPLPPDLYCVDRLDGPEEIHVFLTCPCNRTVCVRKCCDRYKELSVAVFRKLLEPTCVPREEGPMWEPTFYRSESTNLTTKEIQYVLLDALIPVCSSSAEMVVLNDEASGPANAIRLLPNGSAVMQGYGGGEAFAPETWCGDTSLVDGRRRVDNALVCVVKRASRVSAVSGPFYGSLFVLSSLCLAATLVVYALLPALRRTAHARALLCHVAALLAGSLTLAYGQLRGAMDTRDECYVLAFVIQYSMLAAFFWLNAICFDLAWNFREILPPKASNAREHWKFLWYSVYAWGSPAVISAVTAVMDFAEGIPDYLVKPNIGLQDCWFYKLPALFAYFYGPVAVLLVLNLALYAHTALRLVHARRETALVDAAGGGGESARSALGNPRERAILHLKLFLLMGVTWVMECVSVVVGQADAYWYLPDAVNILRGVFVFVLLCCKADVRRRLRVRVRELCCWPGSAVVVGGGHGGTTKAGTRRVGSKAAGDKVQCGYVGPAAAEEEEDEEKRKRYSASSSGDSGAIASEATRTTALSVRSVGTAK